MPEYLAPGVYIEETSFRSKTIEGVSTSTAGFVGPTLFGPTTGEPELLTSFADFERIFGGLDPLVLRDAAAGGGNPGSPKPPSTNYLAQGVRAFFEEGGRRLYVARVYKPAGTANGGRATVGVDAANSFRLTARFPGSAGNMRVTFLPRVGGNLRLDGQGTAAAALNGVGPGDTILGITPAPAPANPADPPNPPALALFSIFRDPNDGQVKLKRVDPTTGTETTVAFSTLAATDQFRVVTLDVVAERPISRPARPADRWGPPEVFAGMGPDPLHPRSLDGYFVQLPQLRLQALTVPFTLSAGTAVPSDTTPAGPSTYSGAVLVNSAVGAAVLQNVISTAPTVKPESRQKVYILKDGDDGSPPASGDYSGTGGATPDKATGLAALEGVEDVSIVAAPGYSADTAQSDAVEGFLISHCERMRYRIAVLDARKGLAVSEVRNQRAQHDSKYAALYYPWVRVADPVAEQEILLPPSGFVAGIYARNDVDHGVHKAPANEVVRLAVGFEFLVNKGQQDVLNPEGVNCFRYFPGRGYRLWGARTISSDPEWKYVNLRRYFAYLERSIEKGTQWAVFENNSSPLWRNIQSTVEDFLFNEWKNDHLLGDKPQEAYFVRCDRTTMTQNDIDNGRLVCLVGVAPVRPAEFVIFRIGQWTADRQQ